MLCPSFPSSRPSCCRCSVWRHVPVLVTGWFSWLSDYCRRQQGLHAFAPHFCVHQCVARVSSRIDSFLYTHIFYHSHATVLGPHYPSIRFCLVIVSVHQVVPCNPHHLVTLTNQSEQCLLIIRPRCWLGLLALVLLCIFFCSSTFPFFFIFLLCILFRRLSSFA